MKHFCAKTLLASSSLFDIDSSTPDLPPRTEDDIETIASSDPLYEMEYLPYASLTEQSSLVSCISIIALLLDH